MRTETMRELTQEEVMGVSGGDRGDSAVGGFFAGGGAGYAFMRGSAWGARFGMAGGIVGAFGGAVVGGLIAVAIYDNYM